MRDNRIVCLLSDRDIEGDGVEVDFFGERTTLPGGPATLALRTGATLLPARGLLSLRTAIIWASCVRRLRSSGKAACAKTSQRITQALANELEALIRVAPEQWHLLQPNWPSDREG